MPAHNGAMDDLNPIIRVGSRNLSACVDAATLGEAAWLELRLYDDFAKVGTKTTVLASLRCGGSSANRLVFKAYYWGPFLRAYRLGERDYDPRIGRFWEPDYPAYADPTRVGGMNPYAYCYNDPITYCDATGHSATAIIVGFVIGALIGIVIAGYIDYRNDGMLFNGGEGDPQWYDYLGAGILGGIIGAGFGYLSSFAWTLSIPMPGLISKGGVAAIGIVYSTFHVSGFAIAGTLAGVDLLSGSLMLVKGFGPRLGHNQYENKQIDYLCRKHHLTLKEREILHVKFRTKTFLIRK